MTRNATSVWWPHRSAPSSHSSFRGDLINHAKSLGQSTSTYQTLTFVLLGMAVLILVTSWLRKRLFMGIVLAMFGLGIFNLHFWGFGIPFLMAGAWLLVRAYRLHTKLKLAGGGSKKLRATTSRGAACLRPAGSATSQQALHPSDGKEGQAPAVEPAGR